MQYETVIGLEVHVQLSTESKLFSGSATKFGAEPNTQANIFDLAMPGTLPVLNGKAVAMAVKFGVAIGAEIGKHSVFDRKNYFYPDLPKGYQVSQLDYPTVGKGTLTVTLDDGSEKVIGVTRAHMEEDAGKSLHEDYQGMTGIDLNRAGTPLLEIVSEPDLRSAKEAVAYLKKLHSIIRYLDISDAIMAQGSMRCDANVSIRPVGQEEFGTRTEIKNINSFKFVERAINYEVQRQKDVLEDGGRIVQETRLYDADKDETRSMRSKEVANDYRYFPEPDLLPIVIDDAYIEAIRATLPELPDTRGARFVSEYGLSEYDAGVLVATREMADYFETTAKLSGDAKLAANWVSQDLQALLNKHGWELDESPIQAERLAMLIQRIKDNTISGKIAKTVFDAMLDDSSDVDAIIEAKGLKQVTDSGALESLVDKVIAENPDQAQQYRDGKVQVIGFLVGQCMQLSKGKANPAQVNEILRGKLS
ncbi:MAG TPA: Asp-tRNA(Asn)/Glu-tRNA(Gln) amidotransferase GatCAB subunit B [Gammaproteobacteria bacterium]|jgi:aspartyl-tRNA(Asn)/glutamyl-tRNA(Gln) amidotransferase subunit B|uniref:Aspartyl/glutamyl-tRNA(Asn/Gln) amidotransferase subunit B n=3 Tax=OM182 clade TaxID=745002 RepID=A0A0R2TCE2_9GAMM|nr:MAG: glutamyl-tRNA amidotransferase [OM182 bacterium BACL3 MAG-120619-bin3]MBT3522087.1 Asp-tRNA(Asn)/Glu-tRNA(Gln) amidotransferase subunit GatB [Gammaproteobacteria bacterium]MDP4662014.1 Asp-tRNA(Asn)/Glu-tRNA(Gln) amidotransferase subunit GatB [OM182 bacterium]MBT4781818.1 Asp-tRNA(Asn)/Glu-tRNA(Gln) amidotransferase subunit GatB [Gammaproteobacteria bacterium]MBT5907383.1 Asp-tRNA(Asn)/Glu-tRNA(Gln) amidotransferase subunit GatB [Gammaproteobacteria bacterium]